MLIYRLLFRLVFARVREENAHKLASVSLRAVTALPGVGIALRWLLSPRDPVLCVHALGLDFPSPVGLAAGVDSNASWFEALGVLGFGFVEVGTVTATPQEGNETPRVFRLVRDRAILNRRGFPNDGASAVGKRLRGRSESPIIGVNVGKTRDTPLDSAGDDYRKSLRELAPFADYVVLNVSSPNTPGLREMQSVDRLRRLIMDARDELSSIGEDVPLLIKIAPDLSDDEVGAIADLAVSLKLDGIIAVNTTIDRSNLTTATLPGDLPDDGGISGAPLKHRALEVLRDLRAHVGDKVTLISVGGIETPDDAWERILAGATLVQAHTGFVYGGPLWPHHMNRALSHRLRATGTSSIQDLVGTESPSARRGGVEPDTGDRTTSQPLDLVTASAARQQPRSARLV